MNILLQILHLKWKRNSLYKRYIFVIMNHLLVMEIILNGDQLFIKNYVFGMVIKLNLFKY